jgi:translation initiation factor IF-3
VEAPRHDNTAEQQHIDWGGPITAEYRINDRIRVPEVRLVGPEGEQVGIVPIGKALELAAEADLDLVEVSATARPPIRPGSTSTSTWSATSAGRSPKCPPS